MRKSLKSLAILTLLAVAPAAMAEQIDNPQYTQWSKYKPGTFVTVQQSVEMPGMAQMAGMMPQTKVTTKLTEVKPESLTLEITTTQTAMGRSNDNKTTQTIPAKIDKPATTAPATLPAGVTGEVKDMKDGKDTVEVKGNKIETITHEFTTTTSGAATAGGMAGMGRGGRGGAGAAAGAPQTAHMKVWNSNDIPGGMVKTETTSTTDQMGDVKMTMTVVDYSIVK